jgi:hypothetical protein
MRARYICAVHVGHAGRTIIGLFSSLYWVNVFDAPLFCRREYPELSATDAWTEIAVGDVPNYALFPCGTVQNGSLCQPMDNRSASDPCELFDTASESDPAQSQQMPGAFQAPPLPERLCGKTCVQDPSEASLGCRPVNRAARPASISGGGLHAAAENT